MVCKSRLVPSLSAWSLPDSLRGQCSEPGWKAVVTGLVYTPTSYAKGLLEIVGELPAGLEFSVSEFGAMLAVRRERESQVARRMLQGDRRTRKMWCSRVANALVWLSRWVGCVQRVRPGLYRVQTVQQFARFQADLATEIAEVPVPSLQRRTLKWL